MKKNLAFLSGLLCSALISAQAVTSTVSRNVQEAAPLNRDIQSVSAEKAESAIKITMHFNSKPVLKGNDKIIIMIDDTAIGGKTPTEFRNRNFKNPATYTKANSSVDYTYITIPNGSNYGACKTNFTWKSIGDDLFEASEQDLTFTISMDYITADAKQGKAGDNLYIRPMGEQCQSPAQRNITYNRCNSGFRRSHRQDTDRFGYSSNLF